MFKSEFLRHAPRSTGVLSKQDIHIWYAQLDQPVMLVQQFDSMLSPDEQAKAKRFYFDQDRLRYTVSRGLLRRILGYYLEIEPHKLQFQYGRHGKPALIASLNSCSLSFNLSHSHELALYAIAQGREVGIDLEYMRQVTEFEQIVERFFSKKEIRAFHALDPSDRHEAFFRGWTQKEAVLKAIGAGLSQPLDRVEVALSPGEPARVLSVVGNILEISRWSLQYLSTAPGYVAALAVEGGDYQITCYQ